MIMLCIIKNKKGKRFQYVNPHPLYLKHIIMDERSRGNTILILIKEE